MEFNPSAHTVMEPGDVLIAMGESAKLIQLEDQLTGVRK
jgi:K+/H+ antiporter YhaU regulatory subunit KhtT